MKIYTLVAEMESPQGGEIKTLYVNAYDEVRAREFAEHLLEEEYPGEEGWLCLSLTLVGEPKEAE